MIFLTGIEKVQNKVRLGFQCRDFLAPHALQRYELAL